MRVWWRCWTRTSFRSVNPVHFLECVWSPRGSPLFVFCATVEMASLRNGHRHTGVSEIEIDLRISLFTKRGDILNS